MLEEGEAVREQRHVRVGDALRKERPERVDLRATRGRASDGPIGGSASCACRDLRDDELVDVEELGEALLRQICLQTAVRPCGAAGLEVRLRLTVACAHLQLYGLEDARNCTRRQRRRVDEHVRRCQIVTEQRGGLAIRASDGDVEDPAGLVKGLEEGDVADQRQQRILEHPRVQQRLLRAACCLPTGRPLLRRR